MGIYFKGFLVALKGAPATLGVSLFALVMGMCLGLLLAVMRMSKKRVLKVLASIYIEVVRGTPMIVQALVVAFGLPYFFQQLGMDVKWTNLLIPALLVCGGNSAAYMAEVIRGGIQAVDKGQKEAAISLGMNRKQVMGLIVLPQAFKIAIPSFGNEFVTLIKETAILSYVGVVEILRSAQLWNASTFEAFPAYIGAALAYLIITYPLSKIFRSIEKKMSQGA